MEETFARRGGKKRAPIHRWIVHRSKGINEEIGQSRDPIYEEEEDSEKKGVERVGVEEGWWRSVEKRGKKKGRVESRVVGWRGTIDFLIKGKLFQKVVGTKSASIPFSNRGIDTDGGKFGLAQRVHL